MYLELQQSLSARLKSVLQAKYGLILDSIPVEVPPELKFGELATPIALQLARTLRKAPRAIAQEIVAELGSLPGFASFEIAGAGYINAHLDRASSAQGTARGEGNATASDVHSLVEHTSINPNKAAHIGHLRNAILGDTFVRMLRAAGQQVTVQNYIDNTGVQVADVVVGFLHLEGKTVAEVRALIVDCASRFADSGNFADAFDYLCWDLYARTSQWYASGADEENAARKQLRYATLHQIEHGGNETAAVAELISTAVLKRHLETMLRLGIEYDFLPRESEILHLKFWDSAFELLKKSGVLYFETEGKNKGCWVMTRPGDEAKAGEGDGPNEDAKVIVRSNGTVTYVGKDIAYHLWKFGLLGKDFGYKKFFSYPSHECWISAMEGEAHHPHFGGATAIYNVIDARQSDPQANVIQALRGMGHTAQADRYTHFSYEMVALTPRCAVDLGYDVSEEDQKKAYIEVSGRKGFGVKADDLIDKLIAATMEEVNKRQTGRDDAERQKIAAQIADRGHEVVDFGTDGPKPCDYPDFAIPAAKAVALGQADRGILIDGSGIGVSIIANKLPGIRAAICHDELTAEISRRHNNANVLCFAADLLGEAEREDPGLGGGEVERAGHLAGVLPVLEVGSDLALHERARARLEGASLLGHERHRRPLASRTELVLPVRNRVRGARNSQRTL